MVDSDKSDSEKLAVLGVVDLEEAKLPMAEEGAPEDEELTKTTKHTFQHSAIVGTSINLIAFLYRYDGQLRLAFR